MSPMVLRRSGPKGNPNLNSSLRSSGLGLPAGRRPLRALPPEFIIKIGQVRFDFFGDQSILNSWRSGLRWIPRLERGVADVRANRA